MELKIFSIRDEKVGAFLQPFFSPTVGSALRSVSDAVNDPSTPFFKHAEDYTLFELGVYDDISASIRSLDAPHSVGALVAYKKQ